MNFFLSRSLISLFFFATLLGLFTVPVALSQISPEEHASHHGGGSSETQLPVSGTPQQGTTQGMMPGMGEMMKGMGVPPAKELYPSLMELPDLPREKWEEVQAKAHARMQSGMDLLSRGIADPKQLLAGG